jgi:hypothetical protein
MSSNSIYVVDRLANWDPEVNNALSSTHACHAAAAPNTRQINTSIAGQQQQQQHLCR